jgi:hypothetical protein
MDEFLNIEDLDEDTINQILGLGTADEKGGMLNQQIAQAQALRFGRGPQGRSYAGVYTAANPLEHLVHGVEGYRAGKDLDRLHQQQQELMGEQVAGRKAFLDALRRRQQPGIAGPMNGGYGPQPYDGGPI